MIWICVIQGFAYNWSWGLELFGRFGSYEWCSTLVGSYYLRFCGLIDGQDMESKVRPTHGSSGGENNIFVQEWKFWVKTKVWARGNL